MSNNVKHPNRYGGEGNPYEVIKVIEAWGLDFHLGNTVKYIPRAGKKDPAKELEDLQKALWYLQRKIDNLQAEKEAAEAMMQAGCDLRQGMFEPELEELVISVKIQDPIRSKVEESQVRPLSDFFQTMEESRLTSPAQIFIMYQSLPEFIKEKVKDTVHAYEHMWLMTPKPVKVLALTENFLKGQIEELSKSKLEESLPMFTIEGHPESVLQTPQYFIDQIQKLPKNLQSQVEDIAKCYEEAWGLKERPVKTLAKMAKMMQWQIEAFSDNKDMFNNVTTLTMKDLEKSLQGQQGIELQRDDSETPHPFHFLKFVYDLPESLAAQVRDIARAYDIMWHMEPKPVRVLTLIARHIKKFQEVSVQITDKKT